ncbi:MAG: HD domain-containing protein [Dehalococcoidales bacterium]|nr:HD domain-containing protein [Dehalococcoidales bacterium]
MMEDSKQAASSETCRLLAEISRLFRAKGIKAFLVGGFLRDSLLGRKTLDLDIAVDGDAPEIARQLADEIGGRYVLLDDARKTARVIIPDSGLQIDLTTVEGDITGDLARRDFTVNAMAIELEKAASPDLTGLIDPFGGRDDLSRGVIRAVSDAVFREDAVRLLRAVRLAAELGFAIESSTAALVRRDLGFIRHVPGERVREELLRIFALPDAGRHIARLEELGILTALIPELEAARDVRQPPLHVWDVLTHSIMTVAAVAAVLREDRWEYAGDETIGLVPWSHELNEHFDEVISHGSTRRSLIRLAALLHDIAKPRTKTLDTQGRARFLGHAEQGADDAGIIMTRLRFSHREIELVKLLITHHLRPTQMSQEGMPTRRAIYRYFRDTGRSGIDLLYLSLADHLATRGQTLDRDEWAKHTAVVKHVLDQYFATPAPLPPRLISGHDIMETFRLPPGPEIGRLLEAAREAQAAGEIKSREEALELVRHLIGKNTTTTNH